MLRSRFAMSVSPDGQAVDAPPAALRLLTGAGLAALVLVLGEVAKLSAVACFDLRIDQHIAAHDRTAALTTVAKAVSVAGGDTR